MMNNRNRQITLLVIIGLLNTSVVVAKEIVTVYTNGTFFTSNAQAPSARSVVIRGDKIAFVGTDSGALAFAGPSAQTIDLHGKLVLPGLVDAHTHPGMVGISHDLLEMELVQDKETLMQNIASMIAANPGS